LANEIAVFDSCVLYSARLRDVFLNFAEARLFQPRWSDRIHEEWINSLLRNRSDLSRRQLEMTRDLMNRFPNSVVQGYETLIPALTLPDPDDRHVLAVAIHSQADAIITANLKDFPAAALSPYGIAAVAPDQFANHLLNLDEDEALTALARMRSRLRNPPMTASEFIDSFAKAGLTTMARRLRSHATRL